MTQLQSEDLERLLAWKLLRYADHLDYDDLVQECRIAAWKAWEHYEGTRRHTTVMVNAIEWARKSFFRGPMNRNRKESRFGVKNLLFLSFSEIHSYTDDLADGSRRLGVLYETMEPKSEDFVPLLLDQAFAEWLWSIRNRVVSKKQAAILEAIILKEQTQAAYAAEHDCSEAAVSLARLKAVQKYRDFLGMGPRASRAKSKEGAPSR